MTRLTRKETSLSIAMMLLLILIILIGLSSCKSANGFLRHAEKDIQKAIAKGAKVDSLKFVKYDTIETVAFRDRIRTGPPLIDEMKLKGLFADLQDADLSKPSGQKIIERISEEICPAVNIDTTYNLELFVQGEKYILPITVKITSSGKEHDYSIATGALRVPVRVETNQIGIKAGHGFWYDLKLSVVVFIAGALTMFILIRAGPLTNLNIRFGNKKPPD